MLRYFHQFDALSVARERQLLHGTYKPTYSCQVQVDENKEVRRQGISSWLAALKHSDTTFKGRLKTGSLLRRKRKRRSHLERKRKIRRRSWSLFPRWQTSHAWFTCVCVAPVVHRFETQTHAQAQEIGFCTLCFCFPTKMLHLNAPFFPIKCSVSLKKVTKMLG